MSHFESFESWRPYKASHFESFRGWRRDKASHFESSGDFRLREVSHGESFEGWRFRKVSHGESLCGPGGVGPSAWHGMAWCGRAGALLQCLDLGMVPRGPLVVVGFQAHGRSCIPWYGYAMRLGKGPASQIGVPSESLLVATLSAARSLPGVGEILGFALNDRWRKA